MWSKIFVFRTKFSIKPKRFYFSTANLWSKRFCSVLFPKFVWDNWKFCFACKAPWKTAWLKGWQARQQADIGRTSTDKTGRSDCNRKIEATWQTDRKPDRPIDGQTVWQSCKRAAWHKDRQAKMAWQSEIQNRHDRNSQARWEGQKQTDWQKDRNRMTDIQTNCMIKIRNVLLWRR